MKWTQVSEQIWRGKGWLIFPFIPVHVWLVHDDAEGGWTLVDAGMKNMAQGVLAHVKQLNQGPIRTIVLTHGHIDHVGVIDAIVEETGAKVYAYAEEIPYMEGERMYPRRKKIEFNVKRGLAQPLPVNEQGELLPVGGLTPYFAPGHSPGHVVFYHEGDEILLAGDLFTSNRSGSKLKRPMPMFTADMDQAMKSARIVEKLKPRQLEVCHGSAVVNPVSQLQAYLNV
ncbi:MBL fold metallo-hydrolase [Paenibacillus terrigena]|uniref:MBL fold metallo-hydrolase n=1 Tax=Paenibacillus terrigena TaxID=369333 RepID=UPI0028D79807|nr:MBL fold metallo-hydrolase [Paenibacillus terrigena]